MSLTEKQRQQTAERQRRFRERQTAARAQEQKQKGLPPTPIIPTMPSSMRWAALIVQARAALETCREEMESYYDDRSDRWQESERGSDMQERIQKLENALSELDDL
jgi:hypothetical protein